ncbi:MAG: pyruvate dehydrogenase complex dihydrolipoamide acetyltransferase [Gemmatimonadetes bacterium]|nr:pyruvate dehydrogenase complex dihydrolipoamide acetyltransferase [Gemmatimonadota bacterium]
MATKVHMEALSPTMEEGQLVRWLKGEGDQVEEGDILAEVETDKATMELVARGSGLLRKQLLKEGGTAPVGAVIGVIAGPDEDIAAILKEAPAGAGEPTHAPPAERKVGAAAAGVAAADKTEQDRAATGVQAAAEAPARGPTPVPPGIEPRRAAGGGVEAARAVEPDGRVKASPLARRLAAETGVELRRVQGTGPGGRITKRDIEAALAAAPAPAAPAAPAAALVAAAPPPYRPELRPTAAMPELEEVPVSQMRKTIAKRLVTSIGPVPTFYLTIEVDAGRIVEARERVNERLAGRGEKTSINDFLIKAVAEALRRHPEVNSAWGENVIRRHGRVHIGVAVAVEDGLITPVVRDADRKGVAQIAREVRELAGRAREKKLAPDEYTGATFSISNLGMFGIEEFTAIINPPEAAILAVGQVEEKPVVADGQVVVRPRMRMTMSCDHRVVDGATGARFLQTLRDFLEEPTMMLA